MPVTIIVKRTKHRKGPEAVIDNLVDLQGQHKAEQRKGRDEAFHKGKHFEDRLERLKAAREIPNEIRADGAQRLDDYDW